MACLFDTEDSAEPGDDFVRGWIRGFVQVDYTGPGMKSVDSPNMYRSKSLHVGLDISF
jgi:hypothetical protein